MPKYLYHCNECDVDWYVTFSMSEAEKTRWVQCLYCYDMCDRVPQQFCVKEKKKEASKQVGQLTEKFIKEAREELKEQKATAKEREFKT